MPRSGFSLHRVSTSSTNILSLLFSTFKIFCCTQTHTWLFKKSLFIFYYCGISGHIHPNCFQLHSQKPWNKKHVPRDDEPSIKNQVMNLCELSSSVKN
jgi:hypothetical protein